MTVKELQTFLAGVVKQDPQAKTADVQISFVGENRTTYYEPRLAALTGLRSTPDAKAVVSIVVTAADKTGSDR